MRCVEHRGGRRADVPREPGGAQAHPQGGLPSHRGARRHGRRGRPPHALRIYRRASSSTRWASPARWPRDHRVPRRGRLDQAPAPGLGGAIGHPRRGPRARRLRRAAHRVRGRRTASTTASRAPRRATGRSCSTASAAAGSPSRIAFKLYACGTMTHPYIDCARRLAQKIDVERDRRNRLRSRRGHGASPVGAARGEAARRRTPTPASSASPTASPPASCSAMPGSTRSPRSACAIRGCARSPPRCATRSTPTIPYPDEFTGHVRVRLKDGPCWRSARRTCAAARTSRCRAPTSRRSSG